MKIWLISDSHGLHFRLDIPKVDMVLFTGDAGTWKNPYQNKDIVLDFIEWFDNLDIKYKIWIAGNHDTSIEAKIVNPKELCKNSIYLEHELIEIEGLRIFGSPYTLEFYNWAFNKKDYELKELWKDIPENLDFLLTHGPPKDILDRCSSDGYRAGDQNLLNKIKEVKPKYSCFGHIHENFGEIKIEDTTFINCAVVDDNYKLVNNGKIIEI